MVGFPLLVLLMLYMPWVAQTRRVILDSTDVSKIVRQLENHVLENHSMILHFKMYYHSVPVQSYEGLLRTKSCCIQWD